jgi:hypothetical protein
MLLFPYFHYGGQHLTLGVPFASANALISGLFFKGGVH